MAEFEDRVRCDALPEDVWNVISRSLSRVAALAAEEAGKEAAEEAR